MDTMESAGSVNKNYMMSESCQLPVTIELPTLESEKTFTQ